MSGVAARVREHRPGLGIAMMLAAYLLFSFIDTSVKWLVLAGLPAMQLAFVRYAGAFAISLAQIASGGITRDRFATAHAALVGLRAFLLVSATVFNFYVLRFLPLTITSAIMFSAPVIVCALSWPVLGERVGPWRWFAIVLGFMGVLVVVRPFGETFRWVALLTVYNAFAMAFYSMITRRLSGVVAAETMQLYMGGLGTVVLFPFAWLAWQAPSTWLDWALMWLLGLWGWGGHELLTRAHGFAPANTLMPYTYSFMIYLMITSYLVFDHLPDTWTVAGATIIVISGADHLGHVSGARIESGALHALRRASQAGPCAWRRQPLDGLAIAAAELCVGDCVRQHRDPRGGVYEIAVVNRLTPGGFGPTPRRRNSGRRRCGARLH